MEHRTSDVVGAGGQHLLLRDLTADIVIELQRADSKAAALCGAAGALLTADVATLSVLDGPRLLGVALLSASLLLAAALGMALWALRPALPRAGTSGELLALRCGADAESLVASLARLNSVGQQRLEERRLSVMAVLARRKFRAVRLAVDMLTVALVVAGIGLLITYMSR
ncbi:Pycsar system effector family protein [Streptomyces sp. NPDC015414]|uniref:Pycsar system effector family protein n=1 Tax=Streptomyces sp. NPDC015414 TaxID=3364957 RepID=UPI0036FFEFA4